MLKLLFLTIILYIIIQHLLDDCEDDERKPTPQLIKEERKIIQEEKSKKQIKPFNTIIDNSFKESSQFGSRSDSAQNREGMVIINQVPKILNTANKPKSILISQSNETFADEPAIYNKQLQPQPQILPQLQPQLQPQQKIWEFDRPNPWTKVILNDLDEYPYYFYIKINIPSLNDYEMWKQIVPNLDFNPKTGELIIPSKEEASALALANLICINFSGQMSIENILNKNLIQISIAKSRNYELVQNKLREQIMENLYGKSVTKVQTNFERDLAMNGIDNNFNETSNTDTNSRIDFTSDNFTDNFEHFTNNTNEKNNIAAYDGSDYSYL